MVARSPIVLNSSSPTLIEGCFSPPTSRQRSADKDAFALSSSPLPSPASLFRSAKAIAVGQSGHGTSAGAPHGFRPASQLLSLSQQEIPKAASRGHYGHAPTVTGITSAQGSLESSKDVGNDRWFGEAAAKAAFIRPPNERDVLAANAQPQTVCPSANRRGNELSMVVDNTELRNVGMTLVAGKDVFMPHEGAAPTAPVNIELEPDLQNVHKAKANKKSRPSAIRASSTKKSARKLYKSAFIILNSDDTTDDAAATEDHSSENPPNVQNQIANSGVNKDPSSPLVLSPLVSGVERSSYFSHPAKLKPQSTKCRDDLIEYDQAYLVNAQTSEAGLLNANGAGQDLEESPTKSGPSLASIIGGFEYIGPSAEKHPLKRAATDVAQTKRQRVEAAGTTIASVPTTVSAPAGATTKPKRVKAVKKKAQTITALATEAFRPTTAVHEQQGTVSDYFNPHKSETEPATNLEKPPEKKEKKPRQRKAKVNDAGASSKTPKTKNTKKKKPSAKKARPVHIECVAKLLPPEAARAMEGVQGFVFGTSSQLAVEDSPTFIRDVQTAMRESEGLVASQLSPIRRSCLRVPTAPHGTDLSIGQASRDLWSVSARDQKGLLIESTAVDTALDALIASPEVVVIEQKASEITATEQVGRVNNIVEEQVDQQSSAQIDSDNYVMLSPDRPESADIEADEDKQKKREEMHTTNDNQEAIATMSALSPRSTVPSRTSSPIRPALKPIDANISLHHASPTRFLPSKQAQPFATRAILSVTPTKRPRGRPRKDASAIDVLTPTPTKKRSRPTKLSARHNSTPEATFLCIDDVISDCEPTPSPTRRRTTPPIAELPLAPSNTAEPAKPTDNIPQTASATAACSHAGLKSTDESWPKIAAELFPKITATILADRSPAVSSSASSKSVPSASSAPVLDWYEKILLYDPIVIEDLTAWLNARGVRVACEVAVRKTKPPADATSEKTGKSRKRAAAAAEKEGGIVEAVGGRMEAVEVELKPWMVQKWCEEKSVCCLSKESLRGGHRARY